MPEKTTNLNLPIPLGNENVNRQYFVDLIQAIDSGAVSEEQLAKAIGAIKIELVDAFDSIDKQKAPSADALRRGLEMKQNTLRLADNYLAASVLINAAAADNGGKEYPNGVSMFKVSTSTAGWPAANGYVLTFRAGSGGYQIFYEMYTGAVAAEKTARQWTRSKRDSNGFWQEWARALTEMDQLDYVRQPGYAVTSGTGSAYTVTLDPAPATLSEGFGITIVPHMPNTGAATLKVGNNAVTALKNTDGTDFSAGDLVAGLPVQFRKVGANFIKSSGGRDKVTGQTQFSGILTESLTKNDPAIWRKEFRKSQPDISTTDATYGLFFSRDNQYVAQATGPSAPYLRIYKWINGAYQALPDTTVPQSTTAGLHTEVLSADFSVDGNYLAVGTRTATTGSSQTFYMFKRVGEVFVLLTTPYPYTDTIPSIRFAPDSLIVYISRGLANGSGSNLLSRLTRTTGTDNWSSHVAISTPFNREVGYVEISPDNRYIALSGWNYEPSTASLTQASYMIYKSGDTYTNLGSTNSYNSRFTSDSKYFIGLFSYTIYLYKINTNNSFTLLTQLSLSKYSSGSIFLSKSNYFITSHMGTSGVNNGYITFGAYEIVGETLINRDNVVQDFSSNTNTLMVYGNESLDDGKSFYLRQYATVGPIQKVTLDDYISKGSVASLIKNSASARGIGYVKESGVKGDRRTIIITMT